MEEIPSTAPLVASSAPPAVPNCPRDAILRKIEFVCLDLLRQLAANNCPKKLIIKAHESADEKQLEYHKRNAEKLAYNLKTLSQIYRMVAENTQATKRDMYYDHKQLYKNQSNLDRSITAVCELLNEQRISLNVLSCSKGIMSGSLVFLTADMSLIDCKAQPVLISESLMEFRLLNEAQFILVVEKDATFQKLIDEGFFEVFPKSLLVTGKGYPDICTRKVLRWMIGQLNIPIFGLFDGDPHGMEILLTYKYGSSTDRVEGRGASIKEIQWIGLKPSDSDLFPIADDQRLAMTNRDFVKIGRLKRRAEMLGEEELVKELDFLRASKTKLELEAISSIGRQFMTKGMLLPRIHRLIAPEDFKD